MSGYKRVNFYELCRLCAQSVPDEKTHIFAENGTNKAQLQTKIKFCLALNITEDDFLPKVVCLKCLKRLEACNTFREECLNSESMLSSYFKNFRQTEDFKKSGKVYIKDTKPTISVPTLPEAVSSTTLAVSSLPVAGSTSVNLKSNLDGQIYTVQLPTLIQNQQIVTSPPKLVRNDKLMNIQNVQTTQQQLAYNINLLNATLKNSVPQIPKELLSNVLVNANGEVIKITPPQELENTLLNALKSKKVEQKRKTVKETFVPDNIVKIDLTNEPDDKTKIELVKNTNPISFNTKIYENAVNSSQSTLIQTSKYQNSQNFSTASHVTMSKYQQTIQAAPLNAKIGISSVQTVANNQNSNTQAQEIHNNQNVANTSPKYVSTSQNPTVILPISEYQNNYGNYHFTQQNLTNITNNNVTNVICNSPEVDSTINSQDLQPLQPLQPTPYPIECVTVTEPELVSPNQSQTENATQTIVKSETSGELKVHECDVCHKRFKRREHLYQHVKLHTGFRPYKCATCQKSFMRKEHMLRHMTLHSGIRKYECEVCSKCFSRNDNLLKHKKTHNKQNSYVCEVCKKAFVMRHYFTQHMQKGCFGGGDTVNVTLAETKKYDF